jgi:hypothetical protein
MIIHGTKILVKLVTNGSLCDQHFSPVSTLRNTTHPHFPSANRPIMHTNTRCPPCPPPHPAVPSPTCVPYQLQPPIDIEDHTWTKRKKKKRCCIDRLPPPNRTRSLQRSCELRRLSWPPCIIMQRVKMSRHSP